MTLDLSTLYTATETAKLADLPHYEARAKERCPPSSDVILTGPAPIWLYLRIAHALHGTARSLTYLSGQGDEIAIFNHTS